VDIAIGVPCREQARWTLFWQCLERLERPAGLVTRVYPEYNNSVAKARNTIVREAMGRDGAQAIFWLDDDLVFAPDVLLKLLARPEDLVLGITMMRCIIDGQPGFRPIWTTRDLDAAGFHPVEEIVTGSNGLMKLMSGTSGGVLTRRAVFERTTGPWWQMGQLLEPDMYWEDIFFYHKARAAGFDVWGDPTVAFGHYSSMVLWPMQTSDGTWQTGLALGGWEVFLTQPMFSTPRVLASA
jgi:GT2 family glycosyltransferase